MNLGNIEFTATITLSEEELTKILKTHIESSSECEVINIRYNLTSYSNDYFDRSVSYKLKDVEVKIKPKNSIN